MDERNNVREKRTMSIIMCPFPNTLTVLCIVATIDEL